MANVVIVVAVAQEVITVTADEHVRVWDIHSGPRSFSRILSPLSLLPQPLCCRSCPLSSDMSTACLAPSRLLVGCAIGSTQLPLRLTVCCCSLIGCCSICRAHAVWVLDGARLADHGRLPRRPVRTIRCLTGPETASLDCWLLLTPFPWCLSARCCIGWSSD